jgi:nickel transport protein
MMINIPALAHKVIIFAYVEGDRVYTESYFSDGKKFPRKTEILK